MSRVKELIKLPKFKSQSETEAVCTLGAIMNYFHNGLQLWFYIN